jgi:hypothetical protein
MTHGKIRLFYWLTERAVSLWIKDSARILDLSRINENRKDKYYIYGS